MVLSPTTLTLENNLASAVLYMTKCLKIDQGFFFHVILCLFKLLQCFKSIYLCFDRDKENSFETIKFWLSKFSSVTVGPGLGRDPAILNTVRSILEYLKSQNKPIVIDAVSLY